MKLHHYKINVEWTGNEGTGTSSYTAYTRDHIIKKDGKILLEASADPAFRGDSEKLNPEELLISAISSCHMLWYLHLCSDAGIVLTSYVDIPEGKMIQDNTGGGRFSKVVLNPMVNIQDKSLKAKAIELHDKAHELCFISQSCNFPITVQASFVNE
ncbi:MAG TPA: OsmC family protein [Saprospiraceae bacterium]|nr:OsmC family protein [Saprospiraceae bacterium]